MAEKKPSTGFKLFCQKTKDYGVFVSESTTRVYMGDEKVLKFLACSRAEGVQLFFNDRERWIVEKLGCVVHSYASSKSYILQCALEPEKFDLFLRELQTALGVNGSALPSDINTPILPKNVIKDPDGNICYECGRCGVTYHKAPRCPECGQLVKE